MTTPFYLYFFFFERYNLLTVYKSQKSSISLTIMEQLKIISYDRPQSFQVRKWNSEAQSTVTEVFKTTSWQPQKNRSAWMICRVHPLQKMSAFKKIFQETLPIHVISAPLSMWKYLFITYCKTLQKPIERKVEPYEVQQIVVLYNCFTL